MAAMSVTVNGANWRDPSPSLCKPLIGPWKWRTCELGDCFILLDTRVWAGWEVVDHTCCRSQDADTVGAPSWSVPYTGTRPFVSGDRQWMVCFVLLQTSTSHSVQMSQESLVINHLQDQLSSSNSPAHLHGNDLVICNKHIPLCLAIVD